MPPVADLRPHAGRPFRFLHVSSAFPRKGVDRLLEAFFAQFTADDPVELMIKTFPNPHNDLHARLAQLQAARFDAPRVIIDETPLETHRLAALYRSAQVLVMPSRGEGFDLPAAEAMALGLPVLVTGHGAHLDFCTRNDATLIPYRFARSTSHLASPDACWVEPDVATLGAQLRELFHAVVHRDPQLEARRLTAARRIRATWRWDNAARAVRRIGGWLEARDGHEGGTAERRIAVLSPWATRCGIAEYAAGLLGALQAAPAFRLDIHCDARTTAAAAAAVHGAECRVAWAVGDSASVLAALEEIARHPADVLLVQHQPSLFRLDDAVCAALAGAQAAGRTVILELHSTQQLLFEHRLSPRAIASLRRLDRIVVHQVDDRNHLLALGIVDNVMMIPLGIVAPLPDRNEATRLAARRELGLGEDDFVLAGFGFALPHKGIDTLVRALALWMAQSPQPMRLLCLNAATDETAQRTLAQCRELAAELGVAERIVWRDDYLPIGECLRLLDAADCVAYPYRDTRESASAAVTVGLASGRPVLVSPSHIFDDVAPVTRRLQGCAAEHVVAGVLALSEAKEELAALAERQQAWLQARGTRALAERFLGTVEGLLANRFALLPAASQATDPLPAQRQLLVDVSELYHRDARTGIQRVVRSILAELLQHPPPGYVVRPVHAEPGQAYRHTTRFGTAAGAGSATEGETIATAAGDVFLGLDLSAHLFPASEGVLRRMRADGVRLHFVIYDLIPLRHSQYCDEALSTAFAHWMNVLGRQADGLHCISAAVAEDVRAWLYHHVRTLPLPEVSHFHLGADIENSAPTRGLPADAAAVLAALAAPGLSFLAVGTIEPRKRQAQMLDAFEVLWAGSAGGAPEGEARLVLVGKAGWKVDALVERLRAHTERGRRLFWIEGASDEYLEKIYAACDCLLAASAVEGFGLPLIEAARRGLPVIARDIPVFREVAGNHAWYFSGDSGEDLALAIAAWGRAAAAGEAPDPGGMPRLTWRESAQALLAAVLPPDHA